MLRIEICVVALLTTIDHVLHTNAKSLDSREMRVLESIQSVTLPSSSFLTNRSVNEMPT